MTTNMLKLNDDYSEFFLFGIHQQLKKIQTKPIAIGITLVATVDYVRNLDFVMDKFLKNPYHINKNNLRYFPTDQKHKNNPLQTWSGACQGTYSSPGAVKAGLLQWPSLRLCWVPARYASKDSKYGLSSGYWFKEAWSHICQYVHSTLVKNQGSYHVQNSCLNLKQSPWKCSKISHWPVAQEATNLTTMIIYVRHPSICLLQISTGLQ